MKIRDWLRVSIFSTLWATPLLAQVPADAEATAKLIGSWDSEANGVKGTDILKADGTFTGSASGPIQGTQVTIAVEGSWSVKEGVIIETITKSNHPEFVPPGATTHDKLIEVTDKTYKARTETGALEVHVKR